MTEDISPAPRNRFIIYLALFLGVILMVPSVIASTAKASPVVGFNAGRIIDDGVFTNSSSMNTSQIQAFLNSKVPTCDTWHASGYGQNPPFTCLKDFSENGRSAAQIIYDVAQQYQINPQVFIVLLQKEQGLITDTWPLASQYRSATGYGCPDTAACDAAYYGLTNQLTWSAKMFRAILNASPTWYTPYIMGNNYIKWQSDSWNSTTKAWVNVCGGTTVNIQNRATQALYNYTPYQPNQASLDAGYGQGDSCSSHGNRNFYLYFTDWFGSTQFPQPIGALIQQSQSTGAIYLVDNSTAIPTRYAVPDWQTMQNYGLDAYPAMGVSNTTLMAMTDGGTLTSLVWDGSSVYLVNNQTRYPVTLAMCTNWGFSCSDSTYVKSLPMNFQTQYLRQGTLLTSLSSYAGVTYSMSAGMRRPIANQKSLSDLGLSNTTPITVSSINSKQPLGPLLMTTPGIVKFSPNNTLYYFNGTDYYSVPSMSIYYSMNLYSMPSLSIPKSSFNIDAPSSVAISYWTVDTSGNHYLVNLGRKILLNTDQQKYWPNTSYIAGLDSLLASMPVDKLNSFVKSGVDYYFLDQTSGDKQYITSMADYTDLGGGNDNTTYLDSPIADAIPTGLFAFPDGSLLKVGSDPAIYVMSAGQLLQIPSMSVLYAYNFNASRLIVYPGAVGYPKGPMVDYGQLPDGTVVLTSSNRLLTLSPTQATAYGLKQTNVFSRISQQFASNAIKTQMSDLLRNSDNGDMYYASNGALHYIGSLETYRSLGGGKTPLTPVDTRIIDLFTVGSSV